MTGADATPAGGVVVGVDVGGTFTDAALVAGGRLVTAKVPTTPDDQSEGVIRAVREAARTAGVPPASVTRFAHGMTVGTNALLEGTGARIALIATEGFGDVLELRRQDRAHLYRLDAHHPPPLVTHDRVVEVRERCGPDGVVTPLTDAEIGRVVARVRALDVHAVAVCLLFSFSHPDHERRITEALRHGVPGVHVSASHEVLPAIREYERASTTAVDAYLNPVLRAYLERLGGRARAEGLPAPQVMQSSGGLIDVGGAAEHASRTVLSGPAGGVIGAARLAAREGADLAITFDMGGTSCDVALVRDGRPGRADGTVIAGRPLHLPMLDVGTVSAGGGSIAWADSGGALRVGPHSAGARPGPAAYGHGGTEATVTDANVVLGRLAGTGRLGGAIDLDPAAALRAVAALADRLGMAVADCARGIIRVANQEMARAVRVVSVERGVDPRGATLIAFGGAGPLHACEVAEEVGAVRVLAPAAAGVLAALGLVRAGERRDVVRPVLRVIGDGPGLATVVDPAAAALLVRLPGARITAEAACRYAGQRHEVPVEWDPAAGDAALAGAFHAAHRARYGDATPAAAVEVVQVRVSAELPGPPDEERPSTAARTVAGPGTIPMDGATCWVPEGWTARIDAAGDIEVRRAGDGGATWTR